MQLSSETKAALGYWLTRSWDSDIRHDADMARFYRFVSQYKKDHGFSIDEECLRQEIAKIVQERGYPFGEYQKRLTAEFVSLAYKILDFLKATDR